MRLFKTISGRLPLLTALLAAQCLYLSPAQAVEYNMQYKSGVALLFGVGLSYGGDKVARTTIAGKPQDSYFAGKGPYIYIGDYIDLPYSNYAFLGRIGYKKGDVFTNAEASHFSTWPMDAGISLRGKDHRFNLGLTRHFSPTLKKPIDLSLAFNPLTEYRAKDFDISNGIFMEYSFESERNSTNIVLRYTLLDYRMDVVNPAAGYIRKDKINADSIGIGLEFDI